MKSELHGIIYTLRSAPQLGELVANRNTASIPFCGRYRLIDFALSSMVNAGMRDVGVIMERDYQSLLDHLSSGKDWGLSRRFGGLRQLPPFALPEAHSGHFSGCMEALRSVRSYIEEIQQPNVVLSTGDFVANIDLRAAAEQHLATGADITVVCADIKPYYPQHRFLVDDVGWSRELVFSSGRTHEGLASTEVYILKKDLLLRFMDFCSDGVRLHFHRDALATYLANGGKINVYVHNEYIRRIASTKDYYDASMDMLVPDNMNQLFPEERPVRTKERAEVSTYYGEEADVKNSLIADGCYIEGTLDSCVLFRGVRVEKGARLSNCVIMQDTTIKQSAQLKSVIVDKDAVITSGCFLAGNAHLPVLVPKGAFI